MPQHSLLLHVVSDAEPMMGDRASDLASSTKTYDILTRPRSNKNIGINVDAQSYALRSHRPGPLKLMAASKLHPRQNIAPKHKKIKRLFKDLCEDFRNIFGLNI